MVDNDLWHGIITTRRGDKISIEYLYQAFKERMANEVNPIEPQPPIEQGAEIKALLKHKGDEA